MVAEIDYNGNIYKMVFGMVATEIIGATWLKTIENGTNSQIQSVAIVLYGGMCNYAEMNLQQKPKFSDVYTLTSDIAQDNPKELERIYAIWEETKPSKKMMENLNKILEKFGVKKKAVPTKNRRRITKK